MRIFILFLLSCSALIACSPAQQPEINTLKVKSYQLPVGDNAVVRDFNGVARAHDLVDLSFRVDGKIASIAVRNGQQVKKGDLLASLDKRDYQVQLDADKARMELTKQQYQRAKLMVDKELMSESEYDTMYAEYQVALANFKMAQLAFDYTDLHAPFDGVASEVFVDAFENVQIGVPILSAHKTDKIEVEIQVPDLLLANARDRRDEDVSFNVTFDAYPEKVFSADLLEIDLVKDPATRSYLAVLAVESDTNYKVFEGMPVTVAVDLNKMTYLPLREFLVPVTAVRMHDGENLSEQMAQVWVYELTSKTVKARTVDLGAVTGDLIEVKSGLNGGDIIITDGSNRLSEDQQVELIKG